MEGSGGGGGVGLAFHRTKRGLGPVSRNSR